MSTVRTTKLTYEAFMTLPEIKQRLEIVDGVMLMAPAPTWYHQWIILRLAILLEQFVTDMKLGVVLLAPADLIIQREPLRVRQPDIFFVNAERTGIRTAADLVDLNHPPEVSPDLVVEVLSPSNSRQEIQEKIEDYRRIGVLECWLVHPETQTIEILKLSDSDITTAAMYGVDDTLHSEVLQGFQLSLADVFGESKARS
jgi:Uma2 family endonuclease